MNEKELRLAARVADALNADVERIQNELGHEYLTRGRVRYLANELRQHFQTLFELTKLLSTEVGYRQKMDELHGRRP